MQSILNSIWPAFGNSAEIRALGRRTGARLAGFAFLVGLVLTCLGYVLQEPQAMAAMFKSAALLLLQGVGWAVRAGIEIEVWLSTYKVGLIAVGTFVMLNVANSCRGFNALYSVSHSSEPKAAVANEIVRIANGLERSWKGPGLVVGVIGGLTALAFVFSYVLTPNAVGFIRGVDWPQTILCVGLLVGWAWLEEAIIFHAVGKKVHTWSTELYHQARRPDGAGHVLRLLTVSDLNETAQAMLSEMRET